MTISTEYKTGVGHVIKMNDDERVYIQSNLQSCDIIDILKAYAKVIIKKVFRRKLKIVEEIN